MALLEIIVVKQSCVMQCCLAIIEAMSWFRLKYVIHIQSILIQEQSLICAVDVLSVIQCGGGLLNGSYDDRYAIMRGLVPSTTALVRTHHTRSMAVYRPGKNLMTRLSQPLSPLHPA